MSEKNLLNIKYSDNFDIKNVKNTAVAIGNFDGIHLGHIAVLKQCLELANKHNCTPIVLTFAPHPRVFFNSGIKNLQIMSQDEKISQISNLGFTTVAVADFNAALANLTPREFVQLILLKMLNAKVIVTGDDFCFGAKRAGSASDMTNFAHEYDFHYVAVPAVQHEGEKISSTKIRHLLQHGLVKDAAELRGKTYYPINIHYNNDQYSYDQNTLLPLLGTYFSKIQQQLCAAVLDPTYISLYEIENGNNIAFLDKQVLYLIQLMHPRRVLSESENAAQLTMDLAEMRYITLNLQAIGDV